MCGIFGILNANENNHTSSSNLKKCFNKGKNRGPEFSILNVYHNIDIDFIVLLLMV